MDLLPTDIIYLVAFECDLPTLQGLRNTSKTFRNHLGTEKFQTLIRAKSLHAKISKNNTSMITYKDVTIILSRSEFGYTLVANSSVHLPDINVLARPGFLGLHWFNLGNSSISSIDERDLCGFCVLLCANSDLDVTQID